MLTSDVIVVGAGAVGLSCAYALARRGVKVRVLDESHVGSGASRMNAGWVVPSMSEPVPSPAALKVAARYALKKDGPLKIGVEPSVQYISFLARMLANCPATIRVRRIRPAWTRRLEVSKTLLSPGTLKGLDVIRFPIRRPGIFVESPGQA